VKFIIPVKVISEANQREHPMARHRRKRKQQDAAALVCRQHDIIEHYQRDMTVRLTRLVPKRYPRLMDSDNLAGSFKHVQDAIADEIRVNDRDVKWEYAQRVGDDYGVEVELIQA